jgi:tetratricopeptide (TPR) repeat protein
MNDWAVIIVIYVTLFISSPLIAVVHELGHAFAYLFFTKPDKIDIYIGFYSNPKNSIRFNFGKLSFYIKRSFPFVKGIGLCKSHKAESNYYNYIAILLAGSFFTLFAAGIISLVALKTNAPLLVMISCFIFLGVSALSLISNLFPRSIDKSHFANLNSDGKQILFVLKIKNRLPDYIEALQYIEKQEFANAIPKLKTVLESAPSAKNILQLLIISSLNARQFDNAAEFIAQIERHGELSPQDLFLKGCFQSLTHHHDEAITTYSAVLKKNRNNILALNNIGSELIEKGAHEVAKQALEKAIKISPTFDDPYGNLGYSKIIQGDLEAGKILADKCIELNENNATAYKALGVYYLKREQLNLANINFTKAKDLDPNIDLIVHTDELKLLFEQEIT